MSAPVRDHAGERVPALLVGLVREARPKQWAKNVLLFAAPGAAGRLTEARTDLRALVAFVAFGALASGTYFLNDVIDVEADRRHPTKRRRPIAAGVVPIRFAVVVAALLIAVGLATMATLGWRPLLVLAIYLATTTAYSWRLKHVAVIELGCVAAGFVLRAIAGGAATDVPISKWFLIVAGAGSLFVVAGKRHGELLQVGEGDGATRRALAGYTLPYLRFVWALSASVAIGAYALWSFEDGALRLDPLWAQLSVVPFVLALLRYALVIEQGGGGAPEDVVLGDRSLLALGALWLLVFGLGVRLAR